MIDDFNKDLAAAGVINIIMNFYCCGKRDAKDIILKAADMIVVEDMKINDTEN